MIETIITIVVFIIILAILVLIHEFGHFIVAKKHGILVEEFGFGFPPRVWGKKIGETLYSINLLPIGGFVKVYGEEYYEEDNHVDPKLKDRAFVNKKSWQKASVIVAGVIMNFILGWAILTFLFTQGTPVPMKEVIIEEVKPNTPAAQVGIKVNDKITQITHKTTNYPVQTPSDLQNLTKKFLGEQIVVTIQRGNQEIKVAITPRKNPPKNEGAMGIAMKSIEIKKYAWHQAPIQGLKEAYTMTKTIVVEILKLPVTLLTQKPSTEGEEPEVQVTGVIGIAKIVGQARGYGLNALLSVMAVLSLNLAVINILPFPALDGGRLVFIMYEWITTKKVNKTFERYMNLFGFIFLLSLMAIITVMDIIREFVK